jgi:hypothetical protein
MHGTKVPTAVILLREQGEPSSGVNRIYRLYREAARTTDTRVCTLGTPVSVDRGGVRRLASRMKRRWRIVLMRSRGELLGYVDATDAQAAEAVAAEQFGLDGWQRRRLLVWELG